MSRSNEADRYEKEAAAIRDAQPRVDPPKKFEAANVLKQIKKPQQAENEALQSYPPPATRPEPTTPTKQSQTDIDSATAAYGCFMFVRKKNKQGVPYIDTAGLYLNGIIELLTKDGFRQRTPKGRYGAENASTAELILLTGNIIEPVNTSYALKTIKRRYVDALPDEIHISISGTQKTFTAQKLAELFTRQAHLAFNQNTIHHLEEDTVPVLEDTPDTAYFAFKNCLIEASASELKRFTYDKLPGRVWRSRIIPRNYAPPEDSQPGHWQRFIENVSNANEQPNRYAAFRSAIGYMLHSYSDRSAGQAVICYDEEMSNGKPQGRTGKGLFLQGLKQLRNGLTMDGKALDTSKAFAWQSITKETQLVGIEETGDKFKFEALFSLLTDGLTVERKNRDAFYIEPERAPKICITSNTALNHAGRSARARQFIIEFSSYYARHITTGTETPVKDEHGIFFGRKWTAKEWSRFYAYQLECVREYLADGLKASPLKNARKKELTEAYGDAFASWASSQKIEALHYQPLSYLHARYQDETGQDIDLAKFGKALSDFAGLFGHRYSTTRKTVDGTKQTLILFS